MRGRFDASAESELPPSGLHYLGLTGMAQTDRIFLSVGAYLRLDNVDSAYVADDPFGKVWIRAVVGLHL